MAAEARYADTVEDDAGLVWKRCWGDHVGNLYAKAGKR